MWWNKNKKLIHYFKICSVRLRGWLLHSYERLYKKSRNHIYLKKYYLHIGVLTNVIRRTMYFLWEVKFCVKVWSFTLDIYTKLYCHRSLSALWQSLHSLVSWICERKGFGFSVKTEAYKSVFLISPLTNFKSFYTRDPIGFQLDHEYKNCSNCWNI